VEAPEIINKQVPVGLSQQSTHILASEEESEECSFQKTFFELKTIKKVFCAWRTATRFMLSSTEKDSDYSISSGLDSSPPESDCDIEQPSCKTKLKVRFND
jgi:hypothetical protein